MLLWQPVLPDTIWEDAVMLWEAMLPPLGDREGLPTLMLGARQRRAAARLNDDSNGL